ncbi:chitobiase/beta-hexosaminidase C-terminal domain-containing protein [Aureisphaera galaxeae]|uniref:chitobiase/beta-hexosaminidase C-terminal domain-containing protein n=1 Tax=Aureisphaera galaxeae TaxID=1538023 RepID=UPI00234FF73C|nr:chitobiase/beta-hexosaminidase C-terminal domain-containing protein [Aureisphaera galaxeae]MDC8006162.1 chitobiase/beta-hexosaminidase C-terminal domain-containing protein [Aureisphaera galaxeae]
MRTALIFSLLVACLGCSEKKESTFVQEQAIPLTQPRIQTTNQMIDSTVTITADLRMEGVELRYTSDGSEPTMASSLYYAPIVTDHPGTYSFRAFHPHWKPSETASITVYEKGHIPTRTAWQTQANAQYPGMGTGTLVNNTKASLSFRDKQWVGFDTIASATAYFENKPFIKKMTVSYLFDTKSWIFPPEKVMVSINEKDTITMDIPLASETDPAGLRDIGISINQEVSSIKIQLYPTAQLPEWHPGKGNKAWLFMDEWIFN